MNLLGLTEPPQPSNLGTEKGIDGRSWDSLSPVVLGFSNQEPKNPGFMAAPSNRPMLLREAGPSGLLGAVSMAARLQAKPRLGLHVSHSHILGSSSIPSAQASLGNTCLPTLGDLGSSSRSLLGL